MKGESRVEAIVYTSNTGSAAQYAEMLAKETGLAAAQSGAEDTEDTRFVQTTYLRKRMRPL